MKLYHIADHIIDYQFIYPETAEYFTRFEADTVPVNHEDVIPVKTTLSYMEYLAQRNDWSNAACPRVEYEALASATSSALIPHGAFLLHSAAFTYHGKAIVCTGPSGIGKTTQYAQWKRNFGNEVKIISGDMNFIVFRDDGEIWVMPSAWNGKERLRSDAWAPLGGIILLEQTEDNSITRMDPKEVILPLYAQICFDRMEKKTIFAVLQKEDTLLRKIPVWKLSSRGDLDSARLCHDSIAGEIYGE